MANYLTIRIRLLIAILASVLPLSTMKAEEGKDVLIPSQGWYVGIEGGMPFGFSTFSSFDMTRRTSVGLLAYMGVIVSTPSSRLSYLPSMER